MKKRDLILLIVLLALVGTYFVLRTKKPVERGVSIFSIDSLSVGAFEIISPDNSMTIKMEDGEWWVTSPIRWKADSYRMEQFFRNVFHTPIPSSMMSSGEAAIIRYNLGEDQALQIKAFDKAGKLRDHVYFGNAGAPHDYLRYAKDDRIYQIRNKVAYVYEPETALWRDPRILDIEEHDIEKIDVTYSRNSYSLIHEPTGWRYKDSSEDFVIHPDNRQMMRVLNILRLLETRVFLDGDNSSYAPEIQNPHCVVTVHLKDKQKKKLTFIRRDNTFYLMVDGDASTLFSVPGDVLDRFTRAAMIFREVYGIPQ